MIEVRRARVQDALPVAAVHVRSRRAAYAGLLPEAALAGESVDGRRALWDRVLARRDHRVSVAELDGVVAGFCAVVDGDAPDVGELSAIYVDPDVLGRGLGRALLAAAEADLAPYRHAFLWVIDGNARARRFYESAGWRPDGGERWRDHDGVRVRSVRYVKGRTPLA